jgi:hypothetical protein
VPAHFASAPQPVTFDNETGCVGHPRDRVGGRKSAQHVEPGSRRRGVLEAIRCLVVLSSRLACGRCSSAAALRNPACPAFMSALGRTAHLEGHPMVASMTRSR